MLVRFVVAHGHRFVRLAAEGRPELAPDAALRDIVERCAGELAVFGLALDDVVRTRLWGRTAADRTAASTARRELLNGKARSASSSYIAPDHFASNAGVALDVLALGPAQRGRAKVVLEYEPPQAPPRYVAYDGMVLLSGVSPRVATLEEAVRAAFSEIGGSLQHAGLGWEQVVKVAVYANRRYDLARVEGLVRSSGPQRAIPTDYVFVDGHAGADAHIEIEATARRA